MFSAFPYIFLVILALVLGVIIFAVVKSIGRGIKNQNSPILSVDSRIVSKRTETSGGGGDTMAWTHYYVTFEFEGGGRLEFQVEGEESGMLAEGDEGKVTFQGTRYVSFVRKIRE
jgi:hypothetical protein